MPSASSKSEKPASSEATDPLKQAIVIVEHKIRNLEKRKSKLDTYRESAKPLTKEQVEAVSKYDEVIQQLELSREYVKQFTCISVENDKLKKRQARKEAQERFLADVNKIKQVLLIQDVLQNMGGETVRDDFLAGRNGAVQLTEEDLRALDDLYGEVSPKRAAEDGAPAPTTDQFHKAAEHLLAIIEGKHKELVGSTCSKLKQLVTAISTSGYFDRSTANETPAPGAPEEALDGASPEEEEEFQENQEILSNVIVPSQNAPEGSAPQAPAAPGLQPLLPGAPVLPAGSQPPLPHILTPNVQGIVPTPVSQVESSFFNAQGFKPPNPQSNVPPPAQNTRQINDVIQSVGGKFNFLQDSELEIAEMNPGVVAANPPVATPQVAGGAATAIPTRTFTNQNFNGQPSGGPAYPPNYPPQPAAYQTFVPGFPGFVAPNTSPTPNNNASNSSNNSTNNTNNTNCNNNIPNPIPMPPTRSPNVGFNQSQQPISSSGFPNQPNTQTGSQPPSQPGFQHGGLTSLDNANIDNAVRPDSERKEKPDDNQDWSQSESTNWADDRADSEWNPQGNVHNDGSNKFSAVRSHRNGGGGTGARNGNGFQGNRNRNNRQGGGYRDSQNNQGGGGGGYYQNQNGYQSRNERNNEYSGSGKGSSEFRDNTFKERGDKDSRDSFGGGFKRGPSNRGPNPKGPMDRGDRGDRQGPAPRNPGGPRPARNGPRPAGGGNGPSYQRPQPNQGGQPSK